MRTIIWFSYFILYLVCIFPKTKRVEAMLKHGEQEKSALIIQSTVQTWASNLLKAAGVHVTVSGKENLPDEPALFVSNHQGNFDIPILLCKLGPLMPIVAKKELKKLPIIRTWMNFFNCIFMDRKDPRQSLQCLKRAQELLEQGQSLIIFPEGTRSKSSSVGEFKPGSLRCALKSGVPIVPIAIQGSYLVMEAHGFWIHPAEVHVTILPPVSTKNLTKERTKLISEEIQKSISDIVQAK
ncbi:lysophospholipid acyltransferase family protein [Anaerovorax sp. IOR16]|uniref:lysophospholipid acyltransferase family protein n=1 Tax=Anaerovorax sp. IOR16 TaxID=2773458 RepID=UPI001AD90D72|nr:lysophospholipid acyltransferase family protein [Anaerovorax sp. IOR16]